MASTNGNGNPDLLDYYASLQDYFRRFENSVVSADDLVQATYAKAYRGLERGSVPRNTRAWLFSIARRVGYSQISSDRCRPTVALNDALESMLYDESVHEPVESILDAETKARLQDALESLTREEQLFVHAYYAPDRHIYDPVTQFGLPPGLAKVRMYRLRKKLRRVLDE